MSTSDLRSRARGGSDVATTRGADLKESIRKMEAQFQLAMPRGVEAKQLVRDAMTVMSANPNLATVDQRSVLGALMTCAQLGLRPGVLGQAWIIPFKGKGQLVIGYQGLIALAQRSGDIASISARIVYEGDHFDYEYGLNDRLVHRPTDGDRGEAIAYYCVVKSTRGGVYWEVISKRAAEVHRDKFAMAKTREGKIIGPWADHFDAMALKTIVMKVLKYSPRSTELFSAIAADESVRVDVSPTADITTSLVDIPGGSDDIVDGEIEDSDLPPADQDPTTQPGWGGGNA
jgi:recombination protein RecT